MTHDGLPPRSSAHRRICSWSNVVCDPAEDRAGERPPDRFAAPFPPDRPLVLPRDDDDADERAAEDDFEPPVLDLIAETDERPLDEPLAADRPLDLPRDDDDADDRAADDDLEPADLDLAAEPDERPLDELLAALLAAVFAGARLVAMLTSLWVGAECVAVATDVPTSATGCRARAIAGLVCLMRAGCSAQLSRGARADASKRRAHACGPRAATGVEGDGRGGW
jgi:hypothetical protein